MKTQLMRAALAALVSAASLAPALAADAPAGYPNRPISLVVPYPAGGGVDLTARTLASQIERRIKMQMRVENRAGGGSMVGNTYVAGQARPDGYTVDVLSNPTLAIGLSNGTSAFDKSDLTAIAGVTFAPVLWVTNDRSAVKDMSFAEVIAYARANPGKVKVGVIPNGAFDIATRIVERETGARFTIVPFQGGKPAAVALLGGNIDIAANYYDEVAQYIDAGQMRPLAISDNSPLTQLPEVPTMQDLGIKIEDGVWGGDRVVAVSSKVDPAIRDYLTQVIADTLADPETIAAFEKVSIEVIAQTAAQEQARYEAAFTAVDDYRAN